MGEGNIKIEVNGVTRETTAITTEIEVVRFFHL